jgi:hypothetical protein
MKIQELTEKIIKLNNNKDIELLLKEYIKVCDNCGEIYTPTHKLQRFCSTICRITNWEFVNQKYLRLPQKK